MPLSLTHKVLRSHLAAGDLAAGADATFRVDQVLLEDATGTMAGMQFEMLGASGDADITAAGAPELGPDVVQAQAAQVGHARDAEFGLERGVQGTHAHAAHPRQFLRGERLVGVYRTEFS